MHYRDYNHLFKSNQINIIYDKYKIEFNLPPPKNIVGKFQDKISLTQRPISSGIKFVPPKGSPVITSAPHWTTHTSGMYFDSIACVTLQPLMRIQIFFLIIEFVPHGLSNNKLTIKNISQKYHPKYSVYMENWRNSLDQYQNHNLPRNHCLGNIQDNIDEMTMWKYVWCMQKRFPLHCLQEKKL